MIILLNIKLTVWNIEDGKQHKKHGTGELFGCKFENIYYSDVNLKIYISEIITFQNDATKHNRNLF